MTIKAYIHENLSTLLFETKALYIKVNATNFAKAVLNNIREQEQEWNDSFNADDKTIKDIAKRYYTVYVASR